LLTKLRGNLTCLIFACKEESFNLQMHKLTDCYLSANPRMWALDGVRSWLQYSTSCEVFSTISGVMDSKAAMASFIYLQKKTYIHSTYTDAHTPRGLMFKECALLHHASDKHNTNAMDPYWEADNCSANEGIPRRLWKTKFHDCYSQLNPAYILTTHFLEINLSLILNWSLVTTAWRVLRLWIEETASRYGG
jgi:hypothetical protein